MCRSRYGKLCRFRLTTCFPCYTPPHVAQGFSSGSLPHELPLFKPLLVQTAMEREAVGQQRERRDGAQETDLSAILERKEQELSSVGERKREAAARRSRELEEKLRAKDNEVSSLKQQMAQLADDFKYNLSLLEDRDAELERFEKTVEDLKAKLSSEQEKSANLNSRAEEAERLCKEKGEELKSLRASLPSQAHTDSAKALQGPPEDPLNPQESAQHSRAETLSKETEHLNSTLNRLANENENLRVRKASLSASVPHFHRLRCWRAHAGVDAGERSGAQSDHGGDGGTPLLQGQSHCGARGPTQFVSPSSSPPSGANPRRLNVLRRHPSFRNRGRATGGRRRLVGRRGAQEGAVSSL